MREPDRTRQKVIQLKSLMISLTLGTNVGFGNLKTVTEK